ncbi:MAG TPA: hypothetical protein VEB60_01940, partial [Candidatus Paceibacterota bacterium]|nr:hypothetical protein [Candidatus Paceibacterota bacterium]
MKNRIDQARTIVWYTVRTMSLRQKTVVLALFAVFIASSVGILVIINNTLMVTVAARGGSLTEGIVGTPRYVN